MRLTAAYETVDKQPTDKPGTLAICSKVFLAWVLKHPIDRRAAGSAAGLGTAAAPIKASEHFLRKLKHLFARVLRKASAPDHRAALLFRPVAHTQKRTVKMKHQLKKLATQATS